MLNVALIGLGWWGQTHIRALHEKSDKVHIDTVVDLDLDLSEKTAHAISARTAPSYEAVLADDAIDAAILVTPHSLHTDQIVAGAAAGKHIFTEKPFALSKAQAERAVAAAETAGIQLGLGHNQRFLPPQVEIKRMINAEKRKSVLIIKKQDSPNKDDSDMDRVLEMAKKHKLGTLFLHAHKANCPKAHSELVLKVQIGEQENETAEFEGITSAPTWNEELEPFMSVSYNEYAILRLYAG